jgi:hypothetical protein
MHAPSLRAVTSCLVGGLLAVTAHAEPAPRARLPSGPARANAIYLVTGQ